MIKKIPTKQATGFTHWILKWHSQDNTQIGVLARHIKQNTCWPLLACNYEEFANYLENLSASERMKTAMTQAWKLYGEVQSRFHKRMNSRDTYRR